MRTNQDDLEEGDVAGVYVIIWKFMKIYNLPPTLIEWRLLVKIEDVVASVSCETPEMMYLFSTSRINLIDPIWFIFGASSVHLVYNIYT